MFLCFNLKIHLYLCILVNETKNPQHLDCGRSIPAKRMGDKTIPDSAEPRLESFYPTFVAGIDLPHQGVVDSYNLCWDNNYTMATEIIHISNTWESAGDWIWMFCVCGRDIYIYVCICGLFLSKCILPLSHLIVLRMYHMQVICKWLDILVFKCFMDLLLSKWYM